MVLLCPFRSLVTVHFNCSQLGHSLNIFCAPQKEEIPTAWGWVTDDKNLSKLFPKLAHVCDDAQYAYDFASRLSIMFLSSCVLRRNWAIFSATGNIRAAFFNFTERFGSDTVLARSTLAAKVNMAYISLSSSSSTGSFICVCVCVYAHDTLFVANKKVPPLTLAAKGAVSGIKLSLIFGN